MELLVKIGADQQGLRETVARMTQQFKSANISMPVSWQPQQQALGQYARIIRPDVTASLEQTFGGTVAQSAIRKGTSLLKGMIFAELSSLAVQALDILGQKFWENVYGVNAATTARIAESHKQMSKVVEGLRAARVSFEEKVHESTLRQASPERRVQILQADKAGADRAAAEAERKRDEAQQDVEQAKAGRIVVRGVSGDQLTARQLYGFERAQFVVAAAAAETELVKAKEKALEADDRYQSALEEANTAASAEKKKEADRKKAEMPAPEPAAEKPSFQADALAQAGLFAGSSLLFNPNFTIEQEQLDVLREINTNVASHRSMFEP